MKILFFLYFVLFGSLFCIQVQGQTSEGQTLHVALRDASVNDLINVIESQANLRFYYDRGQFDSLKITVEANKQSVQKILELAFAGTDFHFSIFKNQVFLTKEKTLQFTFAREEPLEKSNPKKGYKEDEADVFQYNGAFQNLKEHKLFEIGNKADAR